MMEGVLPVRFAAPGTCTSREARHPDHQLDANSPNCVAQQLHLTA